MFCFQLSKLVEDWDIYEVKKWMAVVNLHRYSEIFANHNIDGSELLKLDESRIKVEKNYNF